MGAQTAHTKELQQQLYDEMLGRIKEDDSQVPVPRDGWFYYTRPERGTPYPIYARKRGSLEAAEEIYFDQNEEAKGFAFYSLGGMEVSPNHERLAVLVDTNGYEDFFLRVKDLKTGDAGVDRTWRIQGTPEAAVVAVMRRPGVRAVLERDPEATAVIARDGHLELLVRKTARDPERMRAVLDLASDLADAVSAR